MRLINLCVLALAGALLVSGCGESRDPGEHVVQSVAAPLLDQYQQTAGDLLAAGGDHAQVEVKARQLVEQSLVILDQFVALHPACADYLTQARGVVAELPTITLERIEADYHHDGALPPVAAASCYHAKDLLVHPATVLVLLREKPDDAAIAGEIEEVLAHMDAVRADLAEAPAAR